MSKPSKPSKVPTKVRLIGAMYTPAEKAPTYLVVAWLPSGSVIIMVHGESWVLTDGDAERGRAWEVVEWSNPGATVAFHS